ncbi:MAG: hypothetical protein ACRDIC_14525 [bacterium]
MGKTKVRVLYPMAFNNEYVGGDEISLEDDVARNMVAAGYAEPVKPEVPAEKRPVGRPRKAEE